MTHFFPLDISYIIWGIHVNFCWFFLLLCLLWKRSQINSKKNTGKITLPSLWYLYLHTYMLLIQLQKWCLTEWLDFRGGSVVKNLPASSGEAVSDSGSGRPPRGGNGNSLQYSCLKNFMDRGAWLTAVHGVKSRTWLSTHSEGLFLNAYTSYFQSSKIQPQKVKQNTIHNKIIYLLNGILQGLLKTKTKQHRP